MADKAISELEAAEELKAADLLVLEQDGDAKKLTGQILLNWLTAAADGHGGIASIAKVSTSGLVDTYRITLADTTTFDFKVTNGRGISSIKKTATSGLVDTYTITYNNGTTGTFTVTNGAKGDKGDSMYVWIKYASQEPTASSHSFGDVPDNWIGVYSGSSATAPTDWTQYQWFEIKGEKGETGDPATLVSAEVRYQLGSSGTVIPSGTWSATIPTVAQGKYLWTRIVHTFNSGDAVTAYSVSRMGVDGLGSVVTVCNVSPDDNGNVQLDADKVGAVPITGGKMQGPVDMNGQKLNGLSAPTEDAEAANKQYVDTSVLKAYPIGSIYLSVNSTDPATLFGGEWEQLKDRFLLAAGDTYTAGATGGEATHKLTLGEMPKHTHELYVASGANTGGASTSQLYPGNVTGTIYDNDNAMLSTGGDAAHNNMPPYLVVYMWKRVA